MLRIKWKTRKSLGEEHCDGAGSCISREQAEVGLDGQNQLQEKPSDVSSEGETRLDFAIPSPCLWRLETVTNFNEEPLPIPRAGPKDWGRCKML